VLPVSVQSAAKQLLSRCSQVSSTTSPTSSSRHHRHSTKTTSNLDPRTHTVITGRHPSSCRPATSRRSRSQPSSRAVSCTDSAHRRSWIRSHWLPVASPETNGCFRPTRRTWTIPHPPLSPLRPTPQTLPFCRTSPLNLMTWVWAPSWTNTWKSTRGLQRIPSR